MIQHVGVLRTHDDRAIPVVGEYTIDPTHTSVEFIARHLMITKGRGRFPDVSGPSPSTTNPSTPTSKPRSRLQPSTPETIGATRACAAPTSSTERSTRPSSSDPPGRRLAPAASGW